MYQKTGGLMNSHSQVRNLINEGELNKALQLLDQELLETLESLVLKAEVLYKLRRYLDAVPVHKRTLESGKGRIDRYEEFQLELQLAECYSALGFVLQAFQMYTSLSGRMKDIQPSKYHQARSKLGEASTLCYLLRSDKSICQTLHIEPATALKSIKKSAEAAEKILKKEGKIERYDALYTLWLMYGEWNKEKKANKIFNILTSHKEPHAIQSLSYTHCIRLLSENRIADLEEFCKESSDPVVKALALWCIAEELIDKNSDMSIIVPVFKNILNILEPTQEIRIQIAYCEWMVGFKNHLVEKELKLSHRLQCLHESVKNL